MAAPVRFELGNGLRAWVLEDRRRPIVHVRTVYKVGSLNEGPGTTGLAHYVEHMVYRAGRDIANEDITGIVDRIGGRWTGGTGSMATSYGETVPAWALDDVLRITAERMARSLFDEIEFERERHNVVTEANGFSRSDPLSAFRDALLATSFEVHPYRYSSNSWARDNLAVTRADAFDFYQQHYGPNNAVIAIVGDVAAADVERLLVRHFGSLERAPRSGEVLLVEPPQRAEKRITMSHPEVQPRAELAFRAPQAAHPDYPVLTVLDRVLIRRLGTIADVAITTTHEPRPYPFLYRISVIGEAHAQADMERVVERVQSQLDQIAREGVSAAELRAAREPSAAALTSRAVPPALNVATAAHLAQLATALTNRELDPWEVSSELRDAVERTQREVTAADLQTYAGRWLRRSQRTVGFLVPGNDDFVPNWSDGRPLAGERMEIPPLTVPPEKRQRPLPVPDRALRPLAPLQLNTARVQLANGIVLRAAQVEQGDAALQLRFVFGTAADPPEQAALTLLAGRLLADAAAGIAATVAMETSTLLDLENDRHFDLRLRVPLSDLGTVVEGAAQLLRVPAFNATQVERVRATILQELNNAATAQDAGAGLARRLVLQRAVPAWRAAPSLSAEALAAITATDVHRFVEQRFAAGALLVAIAAPQEPARWIEQAATVFGVLPRAARTPAAGVRSAIGAATPAAEHRIETPGATQVDIAAALPGVPRDHPDWWALQLLSYIVGMPYYGGRLGWALTKSGLTYSSSAATVSGSNAGYILITTRSDSNNLEATLQAIQEIVAQVGEDGVEEWELREAQGFTLGRMLLNGVRDDSDAAAIARALLDSESTPSEWLDLPATSQEILAVSHADLQRVARRYYRPELLHTAAVGALPRSVQASPFPAGTFKALFDER